MHRMCAALLLGAREDGNHAKKQPAKPTANGKGKTCAWSSNIEQIAQELFVANLSTTVLGRIAGAQWAPSQSQTNA